MLYDPNALDAALAIDTDEVIDRLAGVGRDLQDVLGQVSVTKQRVTLIGRRSGRVAGEGSEAGGVRKKLAHLRV